MNDDELAVSIAREAGMLLQAVRAEAFSAGTPKGKELGRAGDARANELILARLAAARPQDAVLSEESADDPARVSADRVWIIDPLDGSREFGLPGRSDWAVHVALWERGQEITAAAVGLPALDVVMARDSRPPDGSLHQPPRILVSDSRPPAFMGALCERLGAVAEPMGSAGAKTMAVVRGEADAYVHAGGQWEWDSAAPVGVARALGLHTSRIDGSPLTYNHDKPYLPDLVIARPELADRILAGIAELDTEDVMTR